MHGTTKTFRLLYSTSSHQCVCNRILGNDELDDRFHETGIDETGSMELEGCWWIPRLRLAERGAAVEVAMTDESRG
jgi:hypothetical protein